jgi:S-formylglutathione hydrolase
MPRNLLLAALLTLAHTATAGLVDGSVASTLVPSPVAYYALVPDGTAADAKSLPLVLFLHGGGGSRDNLKSLAPRLVAAWQEGTLPPMVVVTPSVTERGFYLDTRDGRERWETFITGEFLAHLRQRFPVRADRRGTLLIGASMGGMGGLRLAFKHPDVFGGVAALEPGIEPVLRFEDVLPKHRFWRGDDLLERAYGKPIDTGHYAANNPATIATRHAAELRDAGLAIFLDAGDADMFWLYEGTEFLHQVLWQQRIRHEYRLYHGVDHVGASLAWRLHEGFAFLARSLTDPVPDPAVKAARARIDPLKRRLDEADHYGVDAALIGR